MNKNKTKTKTWSEVGKGQIPTHSSFQFYGLHSLFFVMFCYAFALYGFGFYVYAYAFVLVFVLLFI